MKGFSKDIPNSEYGLLRTKKRTGGNHCEYRRCNGTSPRNSGLKPAIEAFIRPIFEEEDNEQ